MRRGFTLIELLVVITILAILAGAALPYVQAYIEESRLSKTKSDLDEIARALIVFETREGEYSEADLKPLAGRYLSKTPVDPWGTPYVVATDSGTVYSKGPDRNNTTPSDNADNIVVSYLPPLALVSVKWIDRNQNAVMDADNLPDQFLLTFSRKLKPSQDVLTSANLNAWLHLDPDGSGPLPQNNIQSGGWVQSFNNTSAAYPDVPKILSSSKDVILSLVSPYGPGAGTAVTIGKAFMVVSTPGGSPDDLSDLKGNLSLSSQNAIILPQ